MAADDPQSYHTDSDNADDSSVDEHYTLVDCVKQLVYANLQVSEATGQYFINQIHKLKPTFIPSQDLKSFPKSIGTICKVPKSIATHIKYRQMEEFDKDKDDFVPKKKAIPTAYDDIDFVDEPSAHKDDEEANLADVDEPDSSELAERNIDYSANVDAYMKRNSLDSEEKDRMAYFGIENVLNGTVPGMFGKLQHEYFLKAIALTDEKALSDEIVEKLFRSDDKNHQQPAYGNRATEPLFVIDLFIDGVNIFKNSRRASCTPIMGELSNSISSIYI